MNSSKNKNTDYELFAKQVYEELLSSENICIDVKHNQRIQGKGSKHQIDVYWEFEIAGIIHKVAIECKNYSETVSIGKVRDFHSALADIGGIKGIMVTTVGYQSGAMDFAKQYDIKLIVLREPLEEDWTGQIRYLNTTGRVYDISVVRHFFMLDLKWFINNFPDKNPEDVKIEISGQNNEMYIIDHEENQITNLLELENELRNSISYDTNVKQAYHRFKFPNGYIKTEEFGNLKIEYLELTYTTSMSQWHQSYDRHLFTKALFNDISTGKIKFITK